MIIPFRKRSHKTKILSHAGMGALITFGLVFISYFFIDRSLAQFLVHLPISMYLCSAALTHLIDPKVCYIVWPLLYFIMRCVAKKPKIAQAILIFIIAIPLADVASGIIKWVCGRPRPELFLSKGLYGFDFFRLQNLFQSFPSGHATTSGVIGGIFSCFKPHWTFPILGASFLLALTRVFLGMHFLSDIIAGVFLGALIGQWVYEKFK